MELSFLQFQISTEDTDLCEEVDRVDARIANASELKSFSKWSSYPDKTLSRFKKGLSIRSNSP